MKRQILFSAVALMVIWGAEGKLAPPKIEDYTHVCQKSGKTTHYQKSTEPRTTVGTLRKGCAILRELGLDAALDESVLCRYCVSAEKLKLPRFATVSIRPEKTLWRKGDKVEVVRTGRNDTDWWVVAPIGHRYWVNAKYIDADGNILGNNVCIRLRPDLQDPARGHADRCMKMRILPKAAGDPVDWVPVEWDEEWTIPCSSSDFENVEYGEGEDASLDRIFRHLEWTIKGKRRKAIPSADGVYAGRSRKCAEVIGGERAMRESLFVVKKTKLMLLFVHTFAKNYGIMLARTEKGCRQ